jgi:hypothetical protein
MAKLPALLRFTGDGPESAKAFTENKPPIIRGSSIFFEIFIVILSLSSD